MAQKLELVALVTPNMEIGRTLVYGRHIDILVASVPSMIELWHNGDSALLTGEAKFQIDTYHEKVKVRTEELTLAYGELHEIVNYEGTPEYPGDWSTVITLIERARTPTATEMFNLLKNWLRGQYILEYLGVSFIGGIFGYVVKR